MRLLRLYYMRNITLMWALGRSTKIPSDLPVAYSGLCPGSRPASTSTRCRHNTGGGTDSGGGYAVRGRCGRTGTHIVAEQEGRTRILAEFAAPRVPSFWPCLTDMRAWRRGPMSCITYSTTTQYQPVALHYRLETRVVGVADRHAVGVDDGVAVGVPVPAAVDVPVKAIAASICCN